MTDAQFPTSLLAPLFSTAEMRAALDDRARLQRMLDFEAALARAGAAVGIVPAGHAGTIADACHARHYDLTALADAAVPTGNVAISLIDALTAEVGKRNAKAAGFVHWGATSQDVIDTAMVLELRTVIDTLFQDLDRVTKAFVALTGRHRRNMTMARTLLQQALPMPFGLKLAGYAAALARSRERLRRIRKEDLVLQFGGAGGTLAALGEKGLDVSERLAAQLDLPLADGPWHSHRDRFAEIAAAFAILAGTCGKIARDVALLMQSEIAEVSEPEIAGRGGSSTMPHKRNPVGASAALSAAMVAPNLAATILNAQFQEHERAVGGWQVEWVTFPALSLAVSGALRAVVEIAEGMTVDVERMKANLEATGGLVFAEAVSFALAEKLGKAEAHKLVAEIARKAQQDKQVFKDVLASNPDVKLHLSASEIDRLFKPNHYQGTAQTFIDRLVASSQGRAVRRSSTIAHLTEPKMPSARPDQLAGIEAAASAVKATAVAGPAPSIAQTPAPMDRPAPTSPNATVVLPTIEPRAKVEPPPINAARASEPNPGPRTAPIVTPPMPAERIDPTLPIATVPTIAPPAAAEPPPPINLAPTSESKPEPKTAPIVATPVPAERFAPTLPIASVAPPTIEPRAKVEPPPPIKAAPASESKPEPKTEPKTAPILAVPVPAERPAPTLPVATMPTIAPPAAAEPPPPRKDVVEPEPKPASHTNGSALEPAAASTRSPEPAPAKTPEPPKTSNPDDEPGALLEVFAKIEAFAKAAENENTKSAAESERKPA